MAVIKDVNRIPGLRKEFRRANRRRTEVGIFEDAPALVKIGVLNEFGVRVRVDEALARGFLAWAKENNYPTDNLPREGEELIIPERSFMRATFDEYVDKVVMKGGEALAQVAAGEAEESYEALRAVGEALQRAIIDRVAGGDFAPNDPLTIAIKGHSRPLIGKTGVLEIPGIGIRMRVVSK